MFTRRSALALSGAAAAGLILARPSLAMSKPSVYVKDGIALGGTDTVAYFDGNGPVAGSATHASTHMDATWHFASAQNKAKFDADPEAFAPKYGGYCAYAVSKGGTAPTDPEAWTLHEGGLYLNFNTTVMGIWREDIPGNIKKADANWPGVLA